MKDNLPKHFILQLGSLVCLYLSLIFLLLLLFGIINLTFPDSAAGYWQADQAQTNIRLGIAMLLVFFPSYLFLTRSVNAARRAEVDSAYSTLTKWLIYSSLFVGGITLLINLAVTILTFLEGDLTTRFILKALAVLVSIGLTLYFYAKDAQGHWIHNIGGSKVFATVASVVVVCSIVLGLFSIDSPSTAREIKADQQTIRDLREIQWRVEEYYRVNQVLPSDIEEIFHQAGLLLPLEDEQNRDYSYSVDSVMSYSLCADFNLPTTDMGRDYDGPYEIRENWTHDAGNWCFKRSVESDTPPNPFVDQEIPIRN